MWTWRKFVQDQELNRHNIAATEVAGESDIPLAFFWNNPIFSITVWMNSPDACVFVLVRTIPQNICVRCGPNYHWIQKLPNLKPQSAGSSAIRRWWRAFNMCNKRGSIFCWHMQDWNLKEPNEENYWIGSPGRALTCNRWWIDWMVLLSLARAPSDLQLKGSQDRIQGSVPCRPATDRVVAAVRYLVQPAHKSFFLWQTAQREVKQLHSPWSHHHQYQRTYWESGTENGKQNSSQKQTALPNRSEHV